MRKIVFDIETSNAFSEVEGSGPEALDLSVVAIHDSFDDQYYVYTQEELPKLWKKIEGADMLIGFNSDHFDIPLLNKYYPGDLTIIKSLDILKEIKEQYGRRMKLDQIAEGSFGINKSSHGLQAVKWWRNGEYEKVKQYCIDDVRITKQVYDYALENGGLKFKEGGKMNEIKLDTSKWEIIEDVSMTHALPF